MGEPISSMLPKQTGPVEVDFVIERETIGRYLLEDGTSITVRTVPMRIFRKGLNDKGFPEYDIRMQNILDVQPGPQFKPKPQGG